MRKLLLLSLVIASTVSAKTPLNLPAKRALARQISETLVLSRMHPTIIVPLPLSDKLEGYFTEYVRKFEDRLIAQTPLLENYIKLQQDPSSDMIAFTHRIYSLAEKTATNYARSKGELVDKGILYRFGHQWGQDSSDPVAQMSESDRKFELMQVFISNRDAKAVVFEKQGDSSSLELHRKLAEYYQHDTALSEVIADYMELIEAIPSFNAKLTKREVDLLLSYASRGKTSYNDVSLEAMQIISLGVERERNLRALLGDYGLSADFISQQLPRILEHLDQQQVVIADLSGEEEPLVTSNTGYDQDLSAIQKLRKLQRVAASQYVAIWHKGTTSALDYALLELDNQGRWQIASDKKITSDSNPQHHRVSLQDMVAKDAINNLLDERYLGKLGERQKEVMYASMLLKRNNSSRNFEVTYAQLQDPRTLYEATWEFLNKMEWSWYKFSKTIYPQSSREAALFIANYGDLLVSEFSGAMNVGHNTSSAGPIFKAIQEALTDEKNKLSDDKKVEAIESFLKELRSLVAKSTVAHYASDLREEGYLTKDSEKRVLFEKAIEHEELSMLRFSNITIQMLGLKWSSQMDSVFGRISLLQKYGMTEKQLKDSIFTENVFNKLVEGKIVTEKNLNEMRKLLDEKKLQDVVGTLDIAEEGKKKLIAALLQLPFFIQRDGFAKKFANGISSPSDLQNALRNVEENSMYRPIATHLLEEFKNGQRGILNITIKELQEKIQKINLKEDTAKKMHHAFDRKHIVYFVLPMFPGSATEIDNTHYTIPVVKVGQVAYSKEYMSDDSTINIKDKASIGVSIMADMDKLRNHPRLNQLFAHGIGHFLLFGTSFPSINDHKVRALILELFENKGVRRADPDLLTGISSGDGVTEFLEFTDDVIVEDGLPMVPVEKLIENIAEISTEVYKEVLTRIYQYGYVSVATTPRSSTTTSTNNTDTEPDDSGFLLRELPVDLKAVQPSSNKRKSRLKKGKVRGQTTSHAPPQKSEAQLRREAEEQARLELAKQITKLSNDIKRGKDLPEDIPIWLYLRALIDYIGIPLEEVARRADIKDWKDRFIAVVAPETTTLPNEEELQLIRSALTKQIDKNKKISTKNKQEMHNNLQREIENIEQKLIAHGLAQARPNTNEQPSVPHVAESKPEDTTPTVRLPHKGTLKKITAADVEGFLQGKLLPTYQLFSELMLVLDVNTVQELTAKLNETLTAVNSKLIDQQEEKIQLLSVPLTTHLVGYELGNSDFIDRTLWKLQIVAEHIEHPQKTEVTRLLNNIVRAIKIQRLESVEQLNKALKNNNADLRVKAEQFAKIKKLTEAARVEWQEDWLEKTAP